MAASSSSFRLPLILENPSGWGPVGSIQDTCLDSDIPYAPFNKAGRLGKIADWNSQYSSRQQRPGRSGPSDLLNEAFYEEETEDTTNFHLVLGAKVPKKPGTGRFGSSFSGSRNTFRFRPRGGRPGSSLPGHADSAADTLRGKGLKHLHRPAKGRKQELARQRWATYTKGGGSLGGDREPSVAIQSSWVLKSELDFDNLRKCIISARDVAVASDDLARAGSLYFLDNRYERPAAKKEETLVRRFVGLETLPIPATTSEDPVMQRLAGEGHGNVFITDELLSVIMTAERSVYPWDLVVTRKADKLFIDKRNNFTLNLDTVNETATEPPRDHDPNNPAPAESITEVNAPAPLALEATRIGANYQHMVLQQTVAPLDYTSSSTESDGAAKLSRAHRYRLWNVGSNIKVVVRSALDGVRSAKGDQAETLFIRALNEFDPRSDGMNWRQKLASQPGAIIATEMKNNSAKLARWLLQAHLSGADSVLIGYVSRTTYRTNTSHVILGNQLYKPHELISQLSLDVNHCWGVFANIVSLLLRQPEGKYCLLRDSSQLCIFQVPIDETFEKRAHQRVDTEHDLISQALPSTPIASSSSSSSR